MTQVWPLTSGKTKQGKGRCRVSHPTSSDVRAATTSAMNGELGQEVLQQEKQPLLRGQGKLPGALPEAEPQGNGVAASGLLVNAWSPALQATGLPGLGLREAAWEDMAVTC